MKFRVGDPVMHWTYGLGKIIRLERRSFTGQKTLYYVVKLRDGTVWVPADDVGQRLRHPFSKLGFKRILATFSGPAQPLPEDRQERKLQLSERLKEGKPGSLCQLIHDLEAFQRGHHLNDIDQLLMKRAREILLSEWGYALSIKPTQAEADLQHLLSASTALRGASPPSGGD